MFIPYLSHFKDPVSIHWFRRDLRLYDNAALYHALKSGLPVLPVFIFDKYILCKLEDREDRRVDFIYRMVTKLKKELESRGSSLLVCYGKPDEVWEVLMGKINIKKVYANHDYEPQAIRRDETLKQFFSSQNIDFHTFKDHVIFEKDEVIKDDGEPYTVYTPYSKKWKGKLKEFYLNSYPTEKYIHCLYKTIELEMPTLEQIGFQETDLTIPSEIISQQTISAYKENRDFPGVAGTSRLGVHLRFGTLSIRETARRAVSLGETFLNELIWREFYIQILWHFPKVVQQSFKPAYDRIRWINDEEQFQQWCKGETGIPIVDAGIRELNATGYMHNRVRMIVASFLTKNLLIDWRWGEAYFAKKLLDFELASNNGGWQWAAGCGTDATPYFRIFNPLLQTEKFDPQQVYIKKWVPEFDTADYTKPMVDLAESRERCLKVYKMALEQRRFR